MNVKKLTVIAVLLTSPGLAEAQYHGPNAASVGTASAARSAHDDTMAVLEGVLTQKVGDDGYEFRDDTGTIRVEIDEEAFPVGVPVGPATRVRLIGEVDKAWGSVEVDVKRLELMK
jgi:uncharacterized protein (TIGR00156 family)